MSAPRSTLEFRCPKCGGRYFDSHTNAHGTYIGRCLGDGGGELWRPCPFTWKRAHDWRHFVLVTRQPFSTKIAYELAKERRQ